MIWKKNWHVEIEDSVALYLVTYVANWCTSFLMTIDTEARFITGPVMKPSKHKSVELKSTFSVHSYSGSEHYRFASLYLNTLSLAFQRSASTICAVEWGAPSLARTWKITSRLLIPCPCFNRMKLCSLLCLCCFSFSSYALFSIIWKLSSLIL